MASSLCCSSSFKVLCGLYLPSKMGMPSLTCLLIIGNAGENLVTRSMVFLQERIALWKASTSRDPNWLQLSVIILFPCLNASSARQLLWVNATDDRRLLTCQVERNCLVSFAVNYVSWSLAISSGIPYMENTLWHHRVQIWKTTGQWAGFPFWGVSWGHRTEEVCPPPPSEVSCCAGNFTMYIQLTLLLKGFILYWNFFNNLCITFYIHDKHILDTLLIN